VVMAPPENLRSQFSISYGMVLNLLRAERPLRQARGVFRTSTPPTLCSHEASPRAFV